MRFHVKYMNVLNRSLTVRGESNFEDRFGVSFKSSYPGCLPISCDVSTDSESINKSECQPSTWVRGNAIIYSLDRQRTDEYILYFRLFPLPFRLLR